MDKRVAEATTYCQKYGTDGDIREINVETDGGMHEERCCWCCVSFMESCLELRIIIISFEQEVPQGCTLYPRLSQAFVIYALEIVETRVSSRR